MDRTERVRARKYDEMEGETQSRIQELMTTNAGLRAEVERLKKSHIDSQRAGEAQGFIADAVQILAASLDYKAAVESLVRFAVPRLGDWCAVYKFDSTVRIERLAVAGAIHPANVMLPLDSAAAEGPSHVVCTGDQELASPVTDKILSRLGFSPEQIGPIKVQEFAAYLCVPMLARGRSIGTIAFLSTRPYVEADLSLAGDLGRTAGLVIDNARLYREAQNANRLKDQFVAMVSHELRTPLTPILGCVHLLRTARLSEATFARALEMIERNAKAQVQIVEDLLDLSRIVAGKLNLSLRNIEVAPVVEAAIDSVRSMAESKRIEIVKYIDATQSTVTGDQGRLQQVLWNLLSNAIKFTPSGGRIMISVKLADSHVRIQVADTGIGIVPDFLPYIFDRFRQGDVSNSKTGAGLGLGLAIVRHLVELHEGSIEAASSGMGQGTEFTLRLPLHTHKAAHAG